MLCSMTVERIEKCGTSTAAMTGTAEVGGAPHGISGTRAKRVPCVSINASWRSKCAGPRITSGAFETRGYQPRITRCWGPTRFLQSPGTRRRGILRDPSGCAVRTRPYDTLQRWKARTRASHSPQCRHQRMILLIPNATRRSTPSIVVEAIEQWLAGRSQRACCVVHPPVHAVDAPLKRVFDKIDAPGLRVDRRSPTHLLQVFRLTPS